MCRQSMEEEGSCENLPRLIAKSAGKEITVRHSWLQHKRYKSKPQIWKEKNKTNNEPRKTSCDSNNNNEAARRSNEVENSLSKQKHVGHAGQEASRRIRVRGGAVWRLWGNRILLRCRVCLPLPLLALLPTRLMLLTHNLPLYECVNHASFSTAVALSNGVGHSPNPNPSHPTLGSSDLA